MAEKMTVLGDRVVVERLEALSKSEGGILLPDSAKEKPCRGKILFVGPGADDKNGSFQRMKLQPGQKVLFNKWAGGEFDFPGYKEPLLVMHEPDIHLIFEEVKE